LDLPRVGAARQCRSRRRLHCADDGEGAFTHLRRTGAPGDESSGMPAQAEAAHKKWWLPSRIYQWRRRGAMVCPCGATKCKGGVYFIGIGVGRRSSRPNRQERERRQHARKWPGTNLFAESTARCGLPSGSMIQPNFPSRILDFGVSTQTPFITQRLSAVARRSSTT